MARFGFTVVPYIFLRVCVCVCDPVLEGLVADRAVTYSA